MLKNAVVYLHKNLINIYQNDSWQHMFVYQQLKWFDNDC